MTTADSQAKINAEMSAGSSRLARGTCTSINAAAGMTTVNIGGGLQDMPIIAWPSVGWEVWVLYVGPQPICLGPVARAPWGEVAEAPTAGAVLVTGDDGRNYSLPYADSLELEIGDRVVMDWAASAVIMEPSAEVVAPPNPGPGGGGQVEKEQTFFPSDSGTWGSSWFTSEVWSGDSSLGAFFYEGIADTIPDDAEILSVSIYLDAIQTSGGNPTMGVHSLTGKSGPPDTTGAVSIDGGSGVKALPVDFGNVLKTGVARGVGTFHGGYHKFSPANVRNSGALTIRWRTA